MAWLALILLAAGIAGIVFDLITDFPRSLVVVIAAPVALTLGWEGLLRRGAVRKALLGAAGLLGLAMFVAVASEGAPLGDLLVLLLLAGAAIAGRAAFGGRRRLPAAEAPSRPVLFVNPRSGGGKAARLDLIGGAEARGYRTVELRPGDDLNELVVAAVADGADGLAMAGGDGSQAIVAAIAAEHRLPYACIPAGTRNHFALDLGVDRDDVIGALDAFVYGGEHVVDLAEVNGQTFVNNVSLGFYAVAVQRDEYRDAKLRTLLDAIPEMFDEGDEQLALSWRGPRGHEHSNAATILVSNNRYRLGHAIGNATRPRIDDGLLGVTVLAAPRRRGLPFGLQRAWREWSATTIAIESDHPVAAGVDGEAMVLDPPLRFRIVPGVLRARIATHHPGASPSARMPDSALGTLGALFAIAAGRRRPNSPVPARPGDGVIQSDGESA